MIEPMLCLGGEAEDQEVIDAHYTIPDIVLLMGTTLYLLEGHGYFIVFFCRLAKKHDMMTPVASWVLERGGTNTNANRMISNIPI